MKKIFKSKRAFSLIELMVVVAIIGVLASIGIPQYSKFQAKARQSEAKISLAALFTAEESFRQEWNQFSTDLVNIGFGVTGSRLRYKTGFAAAVCTGYVTTGGAPAEVANVTNTWSDGTNANTSSASWAVTITAPTSSGAACSVTTSTFTGAAYGTVGATATNPGATGGDTWTINQGKLLSNTLVNLGT